MGILQNIKNLQSVAREIQDIKQFEMECCFIEEPCSAEKFGQKAVQ